MIDLQKIKANKTTAELLEFGLINIDKPTGPTSFWTSQFVKKQLGLKKTAHLGTLDPMVTGVLPVALGRACRLNEYFMHRDKVYVGIMRIHEDIDENVLKEKMQAFLGTITQLPPVRARVKRANRQRTINKFELLEKQGKDVLFISDVQAGTYIRKLIHDLGEQIGGAHMLELRRTRAGMFTEQEIYTMYDFEKAVAANNEGDETLLRDMIVPGEIVSELLPIITISKEYLQKCLTGSPIFESFIVEQPADLEAGDKVCVFCEAQFVGCYNFIGKDDVVAKAEFVYN